MRFSKSFPAGSFFRQLLVFFGEVELVFGFWAFIFLIHYSIKAGIQEAGNYFQGLDLTEPLFVFVIMVVASSGPILKITESIVLKTSQTVAFLFHITHHVSEVFVLLFVGSLSGSLITEPAAMTLTALLLRSRMRRVSQPMIYFLLAVLFVNISVGGSLTTFAAPPILMVAKAWSWDNIFLLQHFGWKTVLICFINALAFCLIFKNEILNSVSRVAESKEFSSKEQGQKGLAKEQWYLSIIHLIFLIGVICFAHQSKIFFAIFVLFVGFVFATKRFQDRLRFQESFLVALFLGGIVVFGPLQKWWLVPILQGLSEGSLFFGSVFLTAITDNAALTFLGSQVPRLSVVSQYALVAGALAGGGLTLIANAPNAAGFTILENLLPEKKFNPGYLLIASLFPTLIAITAYWVLPF